MLSALLSVGWSPEIRGYLVLLIMVGTLIGGTYLILGTNLGARLGFQVAMCALAGWMLCMAVIWAVYGIGLKGPDPTWKPAEPVALVRDGANLHVAEVLATAPKVEGKTTSETAEIVGEQLLAEGWTKLPDSAPSRGQAVASADAILTVEAEEFKVGEYVPVAVYDRGGERWPKINDSLDFIAFKHDPRYAVVEVAALKPQRSEPGRAPARAEIDDTQPHRYVVMIRDLGARRRPAFLIALGSGIIFFLLAWSLHRREAFVRQNLALKA
ncbi:MAG: hypothetical protein RLZZ305_342 [Actinomycetota bacterium]